VSREKTKQKRLRKQREGKKVSRESAEEERERLSN
jgi:hypothetical protein